MDRNRLMMLGAVLAAVVVIAGGFLLGVSPQLKAAQTAQTEQAGVVAQNAALTTNLSTLKSQYSKLDSLKSQLGLLTTSVPSTAQTSSFIAEVNSLAKSSGVTLTSLTIGDATAYASPSSSTATTTPATTSTASPSASASASAAPVATTPATPVSPTLATSPLITGANFSDLPVTVVVTGSYTQGLSFLRALRGGDRLFVPSTIAYTAAAATTGGTASGTATTTNASTALSWNIGGLIYALTDAASAQQSQQTSTSTAAGSTSGSSSTDTAAGK